MSNSYYKDTEQLGVEFAAEWEQSWEKVSRQKGAGLSPWAEVSSSASLRSPLSLSPPTTSLVSKPQESKSPEFSAAFSNVLTISELARHNKKRGEASHRSRKSLLTHAPARKDTDTAVNFSSRERSHNQFEDASIFEYFPECSPANLSPKDRNFQPLDNPFPDFELKYKRPRVMTKIPGGIVNSYLKFVDRTGRAISKSVIQRPKISARPIYGYGNSTDKYSVQQIQTDSWVHTGLNVGNIAGMNYADKQLWDFFKSAFCGGRTLIHHSNSWANDFARIANYDECVLHAVLCMSATYVMDYSESKVWVARANYHYSQATNILNRALRDSDWVSPDREDVVVTTLNVLACHDIISHEDRAEKHEVQRWYHATQHALDILDACNPAYNCLNPVNVQTGRARAANANLIASYDILAQPVMPLNSESFRTYKWLLNGNAEEQCQIHDATGVSPKLLHILYQVTFFATNLVNNPDDRVTPRAAFFLEKKLAKLRQWSELSEDRSGFDSVEALFASCHLNEEGHVTTREDVTNLTAQSWVSATQVYLQCRLYRRPRSHPDVKKPLGILSNCIQMMPAQGNLFTSQSPFFPIFIMSVVSVTAAERNIAYSWFKVVAEQGSARSSVPPVWKAIKDLWIWMDVSLKEDDEKDNIPRKKRIQWWEQMVDRLKVKEGLLSLS